MARRAVRSRRPCAKRSRQRRANSRKSRSAFTVTSAAAPFSSVRACSSSTVVSLTTAFMTDPHVTCLCTCIVRLRAGENEKKRSLPSKHSHHARMRGTLDPGCVHEHWRSSRYCRARRSHDHDRGRNRWIRRRQGCAGMGEQRGSSRTQFKDRRGLRMAFVRPGVEPLVRRLRPTPGPHRDHRCGTSRVGRGGRSRMRRRRYRTACRLRLSGRSAHRRRKCRGHVGRRFERPRRIQGFATRIGEQPGRHARAMPHGDRASCDRRRGSSICRSRRWWSASMVRPTRLPL